MPVPSLGLEDPLEGSGNPLRYSCLEKRLQYSQQGHKEPGMTEQRNTHTHTHTHTHTCYSLCFEFHLVLAFTLMAVCPCVPLEHQTQENRLINTD